VENDELLAAVLLGAAAGLRTFTPAATLAARGRLSLDANLRNTIVIAAAGELITDKLPWTPARTATLPSLGRIGSGAFCGWTVAGRRGALAGAAAAAASTQIGFRVRRAAAKRTSKLRAALLEDAVAIGVANLATVVTPA
jgi:uncharacterized membrane protein